MKVNGPKVNRFVESLEPPIGMTARFHPPKDLRYRFFYPEFQNRIEKQRVKKAYSPPKKDAGTAEKEVIIVPERTLPDFVKYCKMNKIAFTDSERLYFDINQTRRNHNLYTKCLQHCYKVAPGLEFDEANEAI